MISQSNQTGFSFDSDKYIASLLYFVFLSIYCSTASLEDTESLTIRFSNFLYALTSPGLICGHCLISLQNAAITLCESQYDWGIICFAVSYLSFGGSCIEFLTISFTSPVVYLIRHVSFPHGSSIFFSTAIDQYLV